MRTLPYESGPIWAGNVLLGDTYILGRLIRRGGMSEIFEATHARLPGRFAVKLLAQQLVGNREAFARFCREAEILSELRHPNVVQIFDFNTAPDERPYFVMEYLEGRTLETRLADSEPPTVAATVRLVAATASALAAAHAHGIIHRDLKPANIFLVAVDGQPDELVKVLDFGVSKSRGGNTQLSVASEIQGTPPYRSPEQVQGASAQVDGRTDQFALAAIAYRMLTGHDAFVAAETSAVLYQIAHEPAPPLTRHLPSSWDTAALQAVLDRALAKNPADRYGGMMEFARAFEAAAERMPGTAAERGSISSAPPAPRVLTATPQEPATREPAMPAPAALAAGPFLEASVVPLPIARPGREPVPIALVRPAPREHHALRSVDRDFVERQPIGSLDRIPVTHHRAAALGAFALMIAAVLIATGWYHRLPGAVPVVRQRLSSWLTQRTPGRIVLAPVAAPVAAPTSASPTPVPAAGAPTQAAAPPQPVAATTETAPAEQSAGEAAAATGAAAALPAPSSEIPTSATPSPSAPRAIHRHRQPHFRGHPGSIDLAAPASETPTDTPAPAAAAPATAGFPIAPPTTLAEPPAREPLPPTEPEAPATSNDSPTPRAAP
jgi:eukaryotic-like serine/threonine-protein kinase